MRRAPSIFGVVGCAFVALLSYVWLSLGVTCRQDISTHLEIELTPCAAGNAITMCLCRVLFSHYARKLPSFAKIPAEHLYISGQRRFNATLKLCEFLKICTLLRVKECTLWASQMHCVTYGALQKYCPPSGFILTISKLAVHPPCKTCSSYRFVADTVTRVSKVRPRSFIFACVISRSVTFNAVCRS